MTAFTWMHLIMGTVACVSGLIAFVARKGGRLHRQMGRIFTASMLLTAGGGAVYAVDRPDALTGLAGLFTCYLVLSSIYTVRLRGQSARPLDSLSLASSALLAIAFFVTGAMAPPLEPSSGITPGAYYFFGGIALLAAIGDLASYLKGGLQHRWRIARHLWRMGFALYIALGSILDGSRISVLPETLRDSAWLAVPVDAVAFVVLLWLIVVLFGGRCRLRKNGRANFANARY